jgi:hypothetical protein
MTLKPGHFLLNEQRTVVRAMALAYRRTFEPGARKGSVMMRAMQD